MKMVFDRNRYHINHILGNCFSFSGKTLVQQPSERESQIVRLKRNMDDKQPLKDRLKRNMDQKQPLKDRLKRKPVTNSYDNVSSFFVQSGLSLDSPVTISLMLFFSLLVKQSHPMYMRSFLLAIITKSTI